MTEPIEDSSPPKHAAPARMFGTPARIALSAIAVIMVAAISVVLTLLVSDTNGPRTYTQAEVDAQLAALRSAQPSPSPSPQAPSTEQVVVTAEGTFVGRCVSGQPILARWTLNAGYRLPDPSVFSDPKKMAARVQPRSDVQTPQPAPAVWFRTQYGWGWALPMSGGASTGLLVEKEQNEFVWESFICRDGVFASGPEGYSYTFKIVEGAK